MANLSDSQIDHVLRMQAVGHLGIINGNMPHIVPIAYVFDGRYIYAHSKPGQKLQLMRRKPKVCFQVDAIDSVDKWRSVILYGQYEELKGAKEREYAARLISDRFEPLLSNDVTRKPEKKNDPPLTLLKTHRAIYFRIAITGRFGRYEK